MNIAARATCAPGCGSRHGSACSPCPIPTRISSCQAGWNSTSSIRLPNRSWVCSSGVVLVRLESPADRLSASGDLADLERALLGPLRPLPPQRLVQRSILGEHVVALERRRLVEHLMRRFGRARSRLSPSPNLPRLGSASRPTGVWKDSRRGASGHIHSRRRNRSGDRRGDPPGARSDRRGVRVGRATRRRGRLPGGGKPVSRPHPGVDQAKRGRDQGADHDTGRLGVSVDQRPAPQGARPVRVHPPLQAVRGRALALRRGRHRDRAREHRGPVRGDRVRAGDQGERGAARVPRPTRRTRARRRRDLDQADLGVRLRSDRRGRVRRTRSETGGARSPPRTRRTS